MNLYNVAATRLTLYAYISAIEMDLRSFISDSVNESNKNIIFDVGLISKLRERSKNNVSPDTESDYMDLIQYLDFGDCISLSNKIKNLLPNRFKEELGKIINKIEIITPIRNRVMHSRPIEFDDFTITAAFMEELDNNIMISWANSIDIRNNIKADPSVIFGIKIPDFTDIHTDKILNNLPPAEFDDTGFIGREKDIEMIKKKLYGNYPVISIIGDGGVGKTALILKCLYDILDDSEQPFDAIIWVSLKTRTLNNGEFINIKNTISTTLDIYTEIQNVLIGKDNNSSSSDLINNIHEYMTEFKTLLVLDNLESINSETIRDFLFNIPPGSKVAITSRIGIGEFEARHILDGFNKKDRIFYLRRLCLHNQLTDVLKLKDEQINQICEQLYSNPLAMKWLVANLMKGDPIETILSHTEDLTNYCMSNVYEKLSKDAKDLLNVHLVISRECTDAELAYLINLDTVLHRKALNELMSTNMLKMKFAENHEAKSVFSITEFAREYLKQHCRPSNESFKEINKRIKTLNSLGQNLSVDVEINAYDPKAITYTSSDQVIAAYNLKQAFVCSAKNDFPKAKKFLERAKDIDPTYFEVYKVSAFLHSQNDDYFTANQEYITAIQCKADYAPLLFLYAGFLMRYLDDYEEAMTYTDAAERLDPENVEIKVQKARLHMFIGEHKEAYNKYKEIIDGKNLRDKIKRITYDLSTENLRRWSEVLYASGDPTGAFKLLQEAVDKLDLLDEVEQDNKIMNTVSKIIKTICYNCGNSNEQHLFLLKVCEKFGGKIRYCDNYPQVRKSIQSTYPILSMELREKINFLILEDFKELGKKVIDEKKGVIFLKFKSYAFICNYYYDRIFLHWEEFQGDFSKLNIGDYLSFNIGKNEKGTFATQAIIFDT